MFQDITIEEARKRMEKKQLTWVDVRSPSEYRNASIPGSVNIPLFNDEERAEVGTIYAQSGNRAAKERGLEIFSKKLPGFIEAFREIEGEKAVFCWRGGMRSKTAATVLDLMDIHAYRLQGGYRAYRKWVTGLLENMDFHPVTYVLGGYTGTGKTYMLRALASEGYPVLDLEGMANHRGSIFGDIGLSSHNQKTFDALLAERILQLKNAPYILMEAESKRIGKVVVPEFLMENKARGTKIMIELPVEERVRNILDDYRPWENKEACIRAFQSIKERIHTPVAKEIEKDLQTERYHEAVKWLLEYYYDPRYDHSLGIEETERVKTIRAGHTDEALGQLKEMLKTAGLPLH
ncbi:tRNA 2-selenouridine(34) synthase MnmH [Heyndrickxia coagulans]|uniref:tRNA 2-selenouridine(34) synthase MnmH n=1 Tax=Heyndrickxia coagulans TaxID=1398 RepID=UPI0028125E5C|nr:tRNA 2-selenouridine(34) synthase MnmH [Heyndrickxia coagulans]WMM90266.1 tRNA 2-selenouridine(34) synthase MnmH [Heyndrickxia coagulans]